MPIYNYVTKNGDIIQKLFSAKQAPDQITLQDGRIAKKEFTVCMFAHISNNDAVQDQKKRDQQQKHYMSDYNIQYFQPLKGQSKQQTRKDFQPIKNKLSQQILQKQQKRKQQNKQKQEKKKRTFKETERLYHKMIQQRKQRQFDKNKLTI